MLLVLRFAVVQFPICVTPFVGTTQYLALPDPVNSAYWTRYARFVILLRAREFGEEMTGDHHQFVENLRYLLWRESPTDKDGWEAIAAKWIGAEAATRLLQNDLGWI